MFSKISCHRSFSKDNKDNNEPKKRKIEFANHGTARSSGNSNTNTNGYAEPRILARRYLLTRTGYKYLDVGVNIGPPSTVVIALGDCHGKEIYLTPEMWRAFVERKRDILSHLQSDANDVNLFPSPVSIEDLTVRFGRINNLPIIRLELLSTRLAFSLITMEVLFDYEFCVNSIIETLNGLTKIVDEKYSRYLDIVTAAAKTGGAQTALQAIHASENFNRSDTVECEIAVCFRNFKLT
jgi:hypothetical protein